MPASPARRSLLRDYLTYDQAAEVLGVTRRSIYRYLRQRKLWNVDLGFGKRIPRRAITEYLRGLEDQGRARMAQPAEPERRRSA